jgi:membrane protease YdiL (CAAX protease family)
MSLHNADHAHHRIAGYLVVLSAEWLITAFIWFGCRMQGVSMRSLVGDMAKSWRAVLRDLGLAIAFLIAANTVLAIIGSRMHAVPDGSVHRFLPHGGTEVAVYLLMALTAGICEELIYRGYLQRQFTAWTSSAVAGIVLQSAVFGICHAYQGFSMVLTISIYGCFFGILAHWRGSLRPGMIAHCLQDGAGGLLLARAVMK